MDRTEAVVGDFNIREIDEHLIDNLAYDLFSTKLLEYIILCTALHSYFEESVWYIA